MYFVAMLLKLKMRGQQSKLTVAEGVYAHAAILKTIFEADPKAGRELHDLQRHKQVCMAIVDSRKNTASLRLTFMAEDGLSYATILINVLAAHPTLQLGKVMCDIEAVNLANTEWSGVSTWSDLMGPPASHFYFRFITPTAITKRGDNNNRFMSLYPEPLDVFSGLAKRWRALDGPELCSDLERFIKTGGCVIARHELRTVEFSTGERIQVGFVGSAVYECHKKSRIEYLTSLSALTRFASFTGVGYQTGRGMGAVRVVALNN